MSERSVIIAVGVALLMLGLWLVVDIIHTRPEPGPVALLAFDPATVERIELEAAGSRTRIERESWLGTPQWVVRWGEGGTEQTWPADESRVRAGLRVLATTTVEPGGRPGATAATLSLHTTDGVTHSVRFDDRPIAGRIALESGSGGVHVAGRADASLFDAFVRTGLLAWRDERAVLSPGVVPSRVWVQAGSNSIALARRDGRWALLEPLVVPADGDAVGQLLKSVNGLRVERFLEAMPIDDDRTGFDRPLARIEVEHDLRSPAGETVETRAVREVITVGGPTDLSGTSVYALIEWTLTAGSSPSRPLVGPVVVAISTESLNRLTTSPDPYVARTASGLLPASIQQVVLGRGAGSVHLERAGTGWTLGAEPLVPGDSDAVAALVDLLTQRKADRVMVIPTPDEAPGEIRVRLAARGGGEPGEFILTPSLDPAGVWMISGRVRRFYAGDMGEAISSIIERLGAEP